MQFHPARQLGVVNILGAVPRPGQPLDLGLGQPVEGGAYRADEVQGGAAHVLITGAACPIAHGEHHRIKGAHGRVRVDQPAIVFQAHVKLLVAQLPLNVEVPVVDFAAAIKGAGITGGVRRGGWGRCSRCGRLTLGWPGGGWCWAGWFCAGRGGGNRCSGCGARAGRWGGRFTGGGAGCGVGGGLPGGSLHGECAGYAIVAAAPVVTGEFHARGARVHIWVRQYFGDQFTVLKVAVFPVGKTRHPVFDRGFNIEFGVFVVVGGVEPAANKPAEVRVGKGHLNRAVPFLRGGYGAHRIVAAGGGVGGGIEGSVALFGGFYGPLAVAVVTVHALSPPGLIRELMRDPACTAVTFRGEHRLQVG